MRNALKGTDVEEITKKTQDLVQASMKLGEAIYKAEAEKNPAESEAGDDNVNKDDGDIVDADFEDLDDQKK